MEHYDELGVAPTASAAEIRSSYLSLARRFHPDRLGSAPAPERATAAARMARINAAWSVLSDRDRRAAYDSQWRGDEPASGATIRDPAASFRQYDDVDDGFDPMSVDDTPTGAPTMRRGLTFLPAVLAGIGLGLAVLGFMVGFGGLLSVGILLLVASAASFLLLPLVALVNSSRADLDP